MIKQGDVVCVHEDRLPRQRWKLGTVQVLIVRAAVIRLVSEDRMTEIKRPVQKLYPVEVSNGYQDGSNKEKTVAA